MCVIGAIAPITVWAESLPSLRAERPGLYRPSSPYRGRARATDGSPERVFPAPFITYWATPFRFLIGSKLLRPLSPAQVAQSWKTPRVRTPPSTRASACTWNLARSENSRFHSSLRSILAR
jgi:hypothetical protein